jgi:hypothetical protein
MEEETKLQGSDTVHLGARSGSAPMEGDAQTAITREHLLKLLAAARPLVEQSGAIDGYGFYRPENPHNFFPDHESCSDEEVANHKAACEAWDRGDYKREPGSEYFHGEDGKLIMHILRAPWGIGSYSDTIPEVADLLAAIDCALASKALAGAQEPNEKTSDVGSSS